jgi:Spy/CpxP family protein refolding chaperone
VKISGKEEERMKRIVLSLLLTVVFALPAFAQMMDMPMKENMEGHGQMMGSGDMERMGDMMGMCLEHADQIGLTAEQVNKITPIHREMQKKQIRFKAELKIAEIELKEVMEVKDFDMEKASYAVKKIADMKTAHHLEMLKSMKEVRSTLTDEQFQKMKKMMTMKMGEKKPAKKMMKKH